MKTEPNEPISQILSLKVSELDKANEVGLVLGLTKREYFAAKAMQGYCANQNPGSIADNAKMAVYSADALITALNEATDQL